jgi:hypothetical protein
MAKVAITARTTTRATPFHPGNADCLAGGESNKDPEMPDIPFPRALRAFSCSVFFRASRI